MPCSAARSSSVDLIEWLRQQPGMVFDRNAMASAGGNGQTAICQHLRSIGCEWDTDACTAAAATGHIDTLHWLRDNGCPWNVSEVVNGAARNGCTDVLNFVIEQGEVLDAELLTDALQSAGVNDQLQAAQWLRQRGAQWPDVLSYYAQVFFEQWNGETLAWARAEGCTSPITATGTGDDHNEYDSDTDNEF
jgi:hypothetical protein